MRVFLFGGWIVAVIFVSYKRADREAVAPLVALLEAQGWSVWWDARLSGGEHWDAVIEHEIGIARCVVVVWSPHSVDRKQSYWVHLEAHEGLRRDILVPVIIQHAVPPFAFKLIQARDLSAWDGTATHPAARDLVADVRRTVQEQPQSADAVREPAQAAAREEDVRQDVDALLEERSARLKEFFARYDAAHGTLENLTLGELRALPIAEDQIYNVWVGFRSKAGRSYIAVYVFQHPSGPYILLSSVDRDLRDFECVRARVAQTVGGTAEQEITDRSDDICSVIRVPAGFGRTRIADNFRRLAVADITDAKVIVLHFAKMSAA